MPLSSKAICSLTHNRDAPLLGVVKIEPGFDAAHVLAHNRHLRLNRFQDFVHQFGCDFGHAASVAQRWLITSWWCGLPRGESQNPKHLVRRDPLENLAGNLLGGEVVGVI